MAEPRLIHPVPPPLGLYFRPSRTDHKVLLQALSEGQTFMSGIVFDPTLDRLQTELRTEVDRRNLETVLDPRFMELALPGGLTKARLKLPWASDGLHDAVDLRGRYGARIVAELAKYTAENSYGAVLAPSHYLSGLDDKWFAADRNLTAELRHQLYQYGSDARIYYPLAIPGLLFRDESLRRHLVAALRELPIDAVWLRIHPFGDDSGHVAVQGYIRACQDLHQLGLPIVAERTSIVGIALMAFGAVGGIEGGVTIGYKFDVGRLQHPPMRTSKPPFLPHPRVYVPRLNLFLSQVEADTFFRARRLKSFACRDTSCCRRGVPDMLADPRRHFIHSHMSEVAQVSRVPDVARPSAYLERVLRPATDQLARVIQADLPRPLSSKVEKTRRRLESWRYTLGSIAERDALPTISPVPEGRRMVCHKRAHR